MLREIEERLSRLVVQEAAQAPEALARVLAPSQALLLYHLQESLHITEAIEIERLDRLWKKQEVWALQETQKSQVLPSVHNMHPHFQPERAVACQTQYQGIRQP